MPCPECRHEFQIPKDGVVGLIARTHDKEPAPSRMCEVCSSKQRDIPATVYCVDCSQKLCGRCSRPHLRMRGGPHDVKPLDEVSPECHYCDLHDERVRMYCFDCCINVCSTCCLESHKRHKFERIDTVLQNSVRSIDDEIKQVTSRIEGFHGAGAKVEAESNKLLDSAHAVEQEIKNKGEEAKQYFTCLIDRQVRDLHRKLQSMMSTAMKEVTSQTDAVQLALTELESFKTSSLELKSLQKHVIPGEYHAPRYKFTPVNTDQLLRDDQNYIGHVLPGTANSYAKARKLGSVFGAGVINKHGP